MEDVIAFALIRARTVVRGLWKGLTDEDRRAVAKAAVYEMKKHGDLWNLNGEWVPYKHEGYYPSNTGEPK